MPRIRTVNNRRKAAQCRRAAGGLIRYTGLRQIKLVEFGVEQIITPTEAMLDAQRHIARVCGLPESTVGANMRNAMRPQ